MERLLLRTGLRAEHQQGGIADDPARIQHVPGRLFPLHFLLHEDRRELCVCCVRGVKCVECGVVRVVYGVWLSEWLVFM